MRIEKKDEIIWMKYMYRLNKIDWVIMLWSLIKKI